MKRAFCFFLTLVLLVGLLPMPAKAQESAPEISDTVPETVPAESTETVPAPPPENTFPEPVPTETAQIPESTEESLPETTAASVEATGETGEALTLMEESEDSEIPLIYEYVPDPILGGTGYSLFGENVEIPDLDWIDLNNEDSYVSPDEAINLMRDGMIHRIAPFRLYFSADSGNSVNLREMFNRAIAHTGTPKEGDSLRWQRTGAALYASGYRSGGTTYYTYYCDMEYYTTASQEQELDTRVAALLASLHLDGKTDYEKIKAVYDYICANITYDNDHLYDDSYTLMFTPYAALINGTAVCQGYGLLLYRLALEMGIDCRFISGKGNGGDHGWNIVKLGDRYYNLDATWEASGYQTHQKKHYPSPYQYQYFLQCQQSFTHHARDAEYSTPEFNTAYPMSQYDLTPTKCFENKPHQYSTLNVPATCTEEGYTKETCQVCGMSVVSNSTAALGHLLTETETKAATCTESGAKTRRCTRNGCTYSTEIVIDPLGHNIIPHEGKAATCTEDGWKAYETCSRCSHTTYEAIPALGHDLKKHEAKAAACTEPGWKAYETCSRCNHTTYEAIPALGHDFAEYAGKAPTCTEDGWEAYKACSRCDYSTHKAIPAPGHQMEDVETKAASCTETGVLTHRCKVCDYAEKKTIPALGHDITENVTKEATCTQPGELTRSCRREGCSYRETKAIDPLGHEFNEVHACTRCGLRVGENLSWALTLSTDYLLLSPEDTAVLTAQTTGELSADSLTWYAEDKGILEVTASGEITAIAPGTTYVCAEATLDGEILIARCRVDVKDVEEIPEISLIDSAVSCELYKKTYARVNLLILTESSNALLEESSDQASASVPSVTAARFADEDMNTLFELRVIDGRTLELRPREEAIVKNGQNVKSIASKYSGQQILVTVNGQETPVSGTLTVNVKKTAPKLKAASLSFNAFYPGQRLPVVITGGTVTKLDADSLPSWLNLDSNELVLSENPPEKKTTYTVRLLAQTEEWTDAPVSVSVTVSTKNPAVKLSASSVTLAFRRSQGVKLRLLCSNKKDTLDGLGVTGISAPAGWEIQNFSKTDGSFTLKPTMEEVVSGSIPLKVSFEGTNSQLTLNLKVIPKAPVLTLKTRSVTLNSFTGDSVTIPLSFSPADYQADMICIRKGDDGLAAGVWENSVHVFTRETVKPGTTSQIGLSVEGSKEVLLTVKTVNKAPSVSGKLTGAIDLSFPDSYAVLTPTFRNCGGGELESCTITAAKGKQSLGEVEGVFDYAQAGSQYRFYAVGTPDPTLTYTLNAVFTAGSTTCSYTAKLPVKRTAVKLKLSKTSLTLNRRTGDQAEVAVTCLTKGCSLGKPLIELVGTSQGSDGNNLSPKYAWSDGRLIITTDNDTTPGSYRFRVQATAENPAVTLSVKVVDTPVTASLRASGSIDVIRDSSAVTLTPSYRNCLNPAVLSPEITIESAVNAKKPIYTPVTDNLFQITENANGSFTIRKASGAAPDLTRKYRVRFTFPGGNPVYANITLKSGSASAAVTGTPVLYRADKYSRSSFRLSFRDTSLNAITRLEFKDSKQAALFQLYYDGNGQYAIGFNNTPTKTTRYPTSVTLNLYAEGNPTKPSGTVTVKVQVK